jgi:MerR family transcriptional regulator, mercuric resistance operon regulatory protein
MLTQAGPDLRMLRKARGETSTERMHPVATTETRPFPMRVVMTSRTDAITIGELSRLTGVHIETIRYYERIKMLPKPPRTTGGRRTYGSTHLRLLAFIKRSRELGFSPDDVRELLQLGGPDNAPCRQVRDIALDRLNDIREKIADLRKLERLLAKTVAQCSGTTEPECAVLNILDIQKKNVPSRIV